MLRLPASLGTVAGLIFLSGAVGAHGLTVAVCVCSPALTHILEVVCLVFA